MHERVPLRFIHGRFLQPDPIGFDAGDVNWYRYVGNEPTNWIDPDGKVWSWAATAAGAASGFMYGLGRQTINAAFGKGFSWKEVGAATVGGAVLGAITGLASGDPSAALVAAGITGGLLGGAGEGLLANMGDNPRRSGGGGRW
ncbi:MAG: hypothetical protein NZM04_10395 [Methylacidiphilales bacterium]|nr:hypothetical protein [Candidatus Methylacidiphilales bacterium]